MAQTLLNIIVVLIPLLLLILFLYSLRYLRRASKLREEMRQSEVGFVVDTFHELVAKLKEKEQELEELRKKAEERADDVASYSDNIIESVPSGVVSFDNELQITSVNSSALKILGIEKRDIKGKRYSDVFNEPVRSLIKEQDFVKRAEYLYETEKGKRWLGLTISPLYNRKKEKIGKVLIFSDLTELKGLERQVRLKEWLSSLGEVSLGIAHELRNPMAVIKGYSKLLKKDAPEKQQSILNAIDEEIKTMDRIINDFLSFARPVEPQRENFNLREMIEEILKVQTEGRDDLSIEESLEDCTVDTDPVLLKQAISNLLRNSLEAMPEGGRLSVTLRCSDQRATIVVEDSGGGIPEEIREKIFLPFFTTKDRGTGLGLSIVHKNITTLGGNIGVESTDGMSRFRLEIPC